MAEFFLQAKCHFDSYYSVIIEDNGRVAYAYLMEGEDMVGEVWLYNQQPAPQNSNWHEQPPPYLNTEEYIDKSVRVPPLTDKSEIYLEWTESPDNGAVEVGIYIREKFIAQITTGSKPGWSTLVIKDGPLALVY